MSKAVERDQLIRQGQREWYECEDCDFVGYGRPSASHNLTHPDHKSYRVRNGKRVEQPVFVVNGERLTRTEFYANETVVAALEMAARGDDE